MAQELDIFQDTTKEDVFANSVMAAEGQEAETYWVITSNAKGGDANPFTGDTAQLVQMTEQELRQEYEDSGQIQNHFGTFENYMTYIGESQEWIQSAEWMNASMEYNPSDRKWLHQMNEDVMWKPGEREELERQIGYDQANAKQSAYIGWLNAGSELLEKWGLNDKRVIYNSDGDQFKWTGSGYQKTIKVDDHASFADYAKVILRSVVTSALTAGIGQAINAGAFGTGIADSVGSVTQAVKDALVSGLSNVPGIGKHANTIANFFFPAVNSGGFMGAGATSDPFAILSGVTAAGAGSNTWENAADAVNQAMSSAVIVNLTNAIDNQGDYEGEPLDNGDGTALYGSYNLPDLYYYDDEKGAVINKETGEEYPVQYTVFGSREGGSPYNWIVNLPADGDGGGGGGGGATDGSDSSAATDSSTATDSPAATDGSDSSDATDASSDTTSSSGGSPSGSGGPDWPILTGPDGDVPVNDNPDIWQDGDEDGYAGWVIVSGTGVWGQSGVWVIRNPNTGQTQEIDWDNGTYSNPWEANPNDNDTETGGENQGEGQGADAGSTGSGPATAPTNEAPPAEETVNYPDDGSACWLPDGTIGVKKSGECVRTTDPVNDILGWPYVLPPNPPSDATDSTGSVDAGADNSSDSASGSAADSGGLGDQGTSTGDQTSGESGDGTGTEDGTGTGAGSGDGTGTGTGSGSGDGSGDGSGEGEGEGEGEGGGEGGSEQSLLSGAYTPAKALGIDYTLPQLPSMVQLVQRDWTAPLKGLEKRLDENKSNSSQIRKSLFEGLV